MVSGARRHTLAEPKSLDRFLIAIEEIVIAYPPHPVDPQLLELFIRHTDHGRARIDHCERLPPIPL